MPERLASKVQPFRRRCNRKPSSEHEKRLSLAKNELLRMQNIRLLIVDDSSAMRKMVERALRLADVDIGQVFEASNGKEALAVLQNQALDLILCDINMPEMDGLEFLKRRPVDGPGKGVPVVMITSESGETDVVQALSSGASGYIRKPFTPRQVREQIVPFLTRKV